jgi:eukaryotic-like serine/threonine-protein kinase
VALSPGTRLGPYEITGALGAGGMGEVYRARDTRLGRDVAVKVLPEELSLHADARARFEREARTISGLNHPHICALYDVGRTPGAAGSDGTEYLVMELVEGETLAARLARGPLPRDLLLRTGLEIADALDRAHRSGVVHRDLKPGNVMLTRSGAKLLDFGLAVRTLLPVAAGDLTSTPTLTRPLTADGAVVGTFQYMSPEQLEGREPDPRSDLWALGCVLYESITGKRAFEGASQASLIGAILHKEPAPLAALAPETSPGLVRVVGRCLAKDPDDRWQTARDVVNELREISGVLAPTSSSAALPAVAAPHARRRSGRMAWGVAVVAALAAIAALAWPLLHRPMRVARRFTIAVPGAKALEWPRISPDGRTLAFLAADSAGLTSIWVRPLGSLQAQRLAETAGAGRPFWSPDSRYLAYFTSGQLKKVPVDGGPPQLVATVRGGSDGAWGRSGVILFDGAGGDSIRQVPAAGGEVTPVSVIDRKAGHVYHAWPCFLPDGRHFLFMAGTRNATTNRLIVGTLGSRTMKDLGPIQTRMDYDPRGYVLFGSEGVLMARRFDPRGLRFTGEPFPVAERVRCTPNDRANLSVSNDGTLAYQAGGSAAASDLQWVDRAGRTLGTIGPSAAYADPQLSPDGQRIAYDLADPQSGRSAIWVRDLRRDVASKLTFDSSDDIWPVWSPDGARIAYANNARGVYEVVARAANGTGGVDSLYRSSSNSAPVGWSRDGRWLTLLDFETGTPAVWVQAMNGSKERRTLLKDSFSHRNGVISPDGRWLAYSSDESGITQVYVQPFPGPGGKWQVSANGGGDPHWRGDGREIFYSTVDNAIVAAPVTATATDFQVGLPIRLFERPLVPPGMAVHNRFDVSADGQRFVALVPTVSYEQSSFNLVLDWTADLGRR